MTSTYSGVMTYQMLHDVVATRDLAVQQQRRSSCCCVGVCSSSTKGLVLAPRLQQASGAAVGFSGRQRTNRYPREAAQESVAQDNGGGSRSYFHTNYSLHGITTGPSSRKLILAWQLVPRSTWTRIPGCSRGSAHHAYKSPDSV
jgi:hypothetical protein